MPHRHVTAKGDARAQEPHHGVQGPVGEQGPPEGRVLGQAPEHRGRRGRHIRLPVLQEREDGEVEALREELGRQGVRH